MTILFDPLALASFMLFTSPPPAASPVPTPLMVRDATTADIELIGTARIPGTAKDRSAQRGEMAPHLPNDLLGGFGSGFTYSGHGNLYYAVPDRGPGDGAFAYHDRAHVISIDVRPGEPEPVRLRVERTIMLTGADGSPFIGLAAAFDTSDPARERRLDPEAIAVSPSGTLWTSDEYGPWIDEWTRDGKHLRRLAPPARFRIASPGSKPTDELPPRNTSGRQPNRGFESLAITPDGAKLIAILQSPLIQDGALDEQKKRVGVNIRMIEIDLRRLPPMNAPAAGADAQVIDIGALGASREFVYTLEHASHGVNELLSVSPTTFLVIEKDGAPGAKAACRSIYLIDLAGATDVSTTTALPRVGLPNDIKPVKKSLLLNMLEPRFGIAGPTMPEKVEALAIGPDLPDGRRLLIVASDNDFVPASPSHVWAFAVDPRRLPDLRRPSTAAVPLPASKPSSIKPSNER